MAPLPDHLKGPHITLFGPADGIKMCSYAMNAVDKKTVGEPPIVEEIIARGVASGIVPMWGADDEDSRFLILLCFCKSCQKKKKKKNKTFALWNAGLLGKCHVMHRRKSP